MVQEVPIDKIRIDGGTQSRVSLHQQTVAEYAEIIDDLPPVRVVYDGSSYWLFDGFHRHFAAQSKGLDKLKCEVLKGTQRDAIRLSCGANSDHGLRRTNSDKRRAVETLLNDEEWAQWSDNRLADSAAVSVQFVCNVRRELSTVDSSAASKAAGKPRIGKDGKSRKPPKRNPVTDYFDEKNGSTVAAPDGQARKAVSGKTGGKDGEDAPAAVSRRKPVEKSPAKLVDELTTKYYSPLVKGVDAVAEINGWKPKTKRGENHAAANDALTALYKALKEMRKGAA